MRYILPHAAQRVRDVHFTYPSFGWRAREQCTYARRDFAEPGESDWAISKKEGKLDGHVHMSYFAQL